MNDTTKLIIVVVIALAVIFVFTNWVIVPLTKPKEQSKAEDYVEESVASVTVNNFSTSSTTTTTTNTYTNTNSSVNNPDFDIEKIDKATINSFNAKFINYQGNQRGTNVKGLINSVVLSNSMSENKVSVQYNGQIYTDANISSIVNAIKITNNYNVSLNYDNAGYINTIIIN